MAVLGLAGTFLPQELSAAAGVSGSPAMVHLIVQIAGALYLGAAVQNWMARQSTIGGIYNRPLALGNLVHFLVVAIALGRLLLAGNRTVVVVALTVVYGVFAVAFFVVAFGSSPSAAQKSS